MGNAIDTILNRITMYRLVLYYLIGLLAVGVALSFAGLLFDPYALLFSTAFLIAVCWITNTIFAWAFGVAPNTESVYISALILALIITPLQSLPDLWFLGWSAVLAMASKYILAINKKHLFNPIAIAVAITYLAINQSASWWVGTAWMLPFVIVGGFLLVRKMRRSGLVGSFLLTVLASVIVVSAITSQSIGSIITALQHTLLDSPLFFFAFVILTEPLTTPPTIGLQRWYAIIVGVLFVPQLHIGSFYATPEIALLFGNLFSYVVSPKAKLVLKLKKRIQLTPDVYDFLFEPDRKLNFVPGQYMEWTLGHADADNRGNRRYFTLASAPTENELRVGIKFAQESSSFKHTLLTMDREQEIVVAQLAGDFTLPSNQQQKCVLIAGGIGITPFRSMIQYLIDTRQHRPLVLFYANRTVADIVYKEVFDRAQKALGMKTVYTVTDTRQVPLGWNGKVGYINAKMIQEEVPDYMNCLFYISGPKSMIDSFSDMLAELHIARQNIKTDYFAGLA
jgi:ferredoxin-NADP reductase